MLDDERQQPEEVEEPEETVVDATASVESSDDEGNSADEENGEKGAEGEEQQDAPRRERRQRGPARGERGEAPLEPPTEPPPPPRLYDQFKKDIIPAMMAEFNYENMMEVPRLQKIVLNIGVGEALTNGRSMDAATQDLTIISGQKPVITRARKSIANFKVREGNAIGTAVTLRGARMYHFLDRLVNTALPRIRDFRGLPRRGLDGRGNYTIGIREQIIFPEIDYNQIDKIRGLQVTIATTAKNDTEAIRLLELYGMPFIKDTVEA
ncbi:MAG: 50S ribosomal protein L5 [Chloroflexi bacterium]|nr:50S ribosomal protein L5 [Chloroflexota bacterium]